jgi:hypothetical protein
MVHIAAFRFECDQNTEDVLAIANQSFKQLVRKLKATKLVVKPIAFFFGILTNKLKEFYLNQVPENSNGSKHFAMCLKQAKLCTMTGCR